MPRIYWYMVIYFGRNSLHWHRLSQRLMTVLNTVGVKQCEGNMCANIFNISVSPDRFAGPSSTRRTPPCPPCHQLYYSYWPHFNCLVATYSAPTRLLLDVHLHGRSPIRRGRCRTAAASTCWSSPASPAAPSRGCRRSHGSRS